MGRTITVDSRPVNMYDCFTVGTGPTQQETEMTKTIAELEKIHEGAEILLATIRKMHAEGTITDEVLRLAEENEANHWFRLEKARDHASDVQASF